MLSLRQIVVKSFASLPTITFTRNISLSNISWNSSQLPPPAKQEELITDLQEFFKETGLDDLGAYQTVIAAGGYHPNPNDKVDTFVRATIEPRDAEGRTIKLKGKDGRIFTRIHMPKDKSFWPKYKGYWSLA